MATPSGEEIQQLYEHQTVMVVTMKTLLEKLLDDVRRQNDSIGTSTVQRRSSYSAKQFGGYPTSLLKAKISAPLLEDLTCSICLSIVKDCHQCHNAHKFCYGCIYTWTVSRRGNYDKCPICREPGKYARVNHINDALENRLIVSCQEIDCLWEGKLCDHSSHKHTALADGLGVDQRDAASRKDRESQQSQVQHGFDIPHRDIPVDSYKSIDVDVRHVIETRVEGIEELMAACQANIAALLALTNLRLSERNRFFEQYQSNDMSESRRRELQFAEIRSLNDHLDGAVEELGNIMEAFDEHVE